MSTETTEKIAAKSDIGLRRKNNEDAAYAITNPYGTLLVVADGMGGHRKGEVASKIVIDALSIPFSQERHHFSAHRAKHFFRKNVKKANREIYRLSLSGDEYKEMGTTAVAAIIGEKDSYVVSVGDSRAYILTPEGKLEQLTTDQTYVELLFESGKITRSEIATHPQKNLLINAVGINPDLTNVEEFSLTNDSFNTLMLCSDGLYNMVHDADIQKVLLDTSLSTAKKADELIALALQNGGIDNIAVVLWEK